MLLENTFRVDHIRTYSDNYVWIITIPNAESNSPREVIIIDPGDAKPIISYCEQHDLTPIAIFITHSHWDHVTGLKEVHERFKAPVYAPEHPNIPVITHPLAEGENISIRGYSFEIWNLPGHLPEHVAYLTQRTPHGPHQIFSGDVMFSAGCGRIFDGTFEQLKCSLDRINTLPEDTLVYGTHEYTHANLAFAHAVEPQNTHIQLKITEVERANASLIPTLPTQLKIERLINPFLRYAQPSVITSCTKRANAELTSDLDVFTCLREWKNIF